MIGKLYVLKAPGGQLIAETAALNRSTCWAKGFDFLGRADAAWEQKYWKRWDASQASARRRGYRIVKAELVEVK